MSRAIVMTAKSNKYADVIVKDAYLYQTLGLSLTPGNWPPRRWKQLEDDTSAGGYNLLDIGGPGSGISLREGRRVDVRKIDCRITIEIPGIQGQTRECIPTSLEFVMVLDKQANGAKPSAPWYDDDELNCHVNLDTLGRYEVLKRKRLYSNGKAVWTNNGTNTTNEIGNTRYSFTMKKTWKKPLRVNFNSTATAGTGLLFSGTVDNSVTIFAIHDNVGTADVTKPPYTGSFQVTLDWRTTFQDAT